MRDGYGRTIDYLRISLTDRCNLRCIYCMPADGVKQMGHDDILSLEEVARIVRVASELGIAKIRLTGGEPLVRLGIEDLVREIAALPGIRDISLTTNGILLPRFAAGLREAGLNRVNISLDTLDADQFRQITRCGNLGDVLEGIRAAEEAGLSPLKINAVAVRRLNQDYLAFARLSAEHPYHVRFIEYMPVGESAGADGCGWGVEDVISCEELREAIDEAAAAQGLPALEPVRAGDGPLGWGPARYWRFPGAPGTVGFISPVSRHFCSECNRLRLTADGRLRPCLFSDDETDLREAVRTGTDADIRALFETVIGRKPDEHHDKQGTSRKMSQIGG